MSNWDYAKTGERVRRLRREKGWSQEELGKRCGISLNFVGQIERGTRSMSLDTFARLCKELEVNADLLLWGEHRASEAGIQEEGGYAMYVRMMRSVADRFEELEDKEEMASNDSAKDEKRDAYSRKNDEDHANI